MKKLIAILLTFVLAFSSLSAFAYNAEDAEKKADFLKALELFKGTDKGYELEKSLTRLEALIMLIRLSGNEMNALYPEQEYEHPFTDAPEWEGAENYMAYGYANSITSGVSETLFAPNTEASLQMYVTFVLRALGYTDNTWENWEALGRETGIINETTDMTSFKRGDAVVIARAALDTKLKDQDITLKEKLISEYVINEFALSIAEIAEGKKVSSKSSLKEILAKVYSGIEDIYPQGLMNMTFEISDGKYFIDGNETEKDEFIPYLSSFIGADGDKISLTEAVVCEPMMSARAHSVAVLRIKEGADIEAAKKEIKENVDPRKWVCVGVNPKNVRVENIGNLILLAMDDSAADKLCANFRSMDDSLVTPDEKGYLLIDGVYMEADSAFNQASAEKFIEKFTALKEKHFAESKTYFATVPEKGYFAKDKTIAFLNHDSISAILSSGLYDWTEIDLSTELSLGDYYLTDRHWKQENLTKVMTKIAEAMEFEFKADSYEAKSFDGYIGDYKKDIKDLPSEKLTYLVSEAISNAKVDNFQNKNVTTVYDEAKFTSDIPYDVFLSGATPLTVITNEKAGNGRELVIFRDSYGSSIAPLFVDSYSKITLVDLRYMASSALSQYVDFDGAEVLVLMSDKIVNNSVLLK